MQSKLRVLNQVKLSLLLSPSKAVNCGRYEMFVDKDVGKICGSNEEQVHEQSKWKDLETAPPEEIACCKKIEDTRHVFITYQVRSEGYKKILEGWKVLAECRPVSLCRKNLSFSFPH